MKKVFDKLPVWAQWLLRLIVLLATPVIIFTIVAFIIALIGAIGQSRGLIYMRTESLLFTFIPFSAAIIASLFMYWSKLKRPALLVFGISLAAVIAFVGTAAVFETIRTKPIVALEESFQVPSQMVREVGTNGDKFGAATSGFLPCIDFMGDGCPHIARTWSAAPERELTVSDLQQAINDSGWSDVKIDYENCDLSEQENGGYAMCEAEGNVGNYKATVRISNVQNWQLDLYLRLVNNVR